MRIAISTPDPLFGETLACFVDTRGPFEVVAIERDARALLSAVRDRDAKLLVVDAERLSPVDVAVVVHGKKLGDFHLALLTIGDPEPYRRTGADRIVRREDGGAALVQALVDLTTPGRLDTSLARSERKVYGSRDDGRLSRREFEIAAHVAKGLSNRRIANVTGLREQSVKNLVSVVMRKLDCDNRVQVALKLVHASVDQTSGSD